MVVMGKKMNTAKFTYFRLYDEWISDMAKKKSTGSVWCCLTEFYCV